MEEFDDIALLRQYTEQNSEEAFAALVARHINKVYSVALRHTRNPHQAEEITQTVFVILAKKARRLGKRVVLSGWLYETSRLTAVTFIRSEIRRARREQEAQMQTLSDQSGSSVWLQIAPLLDAAMSGLSEADRHAIVLRFFDGRSMKEVGAALGGSEDAAKMRVNRAVEKLRLFFTKRGVVLSSAALTAAISANSVQAAPVQLTASVMAASLAHAPEAVGSFSVLAKVLAVAASVLVIGGSAYFLTAGGQKSNGPEFGPVHELFLNNSGNATYLDLDASRVLPDYTGTAFEDWKKENGVDIALPKTTTRDGIYCFELKLSRYHNSGWKEMSAQNVLWIMPRNETGMVPGESDFVPSGTYVFQTREGGTGIMQINLYNAYPRSIRIRYKLVREKGSSTPEVRK